ncbi:MAG TPA: uracil-DNA glycosylase [Bryobacteraceae bacterium]
MKSLEVLNREIIVCRKCPRLVEFREHIAQVKRRAYRECDYWGKPVPGFGDPKASVLLIGLAPGAHGANRTGRVFTGDRSGEFLYRAMYETGFASQPTGASREDGLQLFDAYISAAVRCVPPDNKPLPQEIRNCRPFLERELGLLKNVRVIVALGRLAFDAYLTILQDQSKISRRSQFVFGHGVEHRTGAGQPLLIGSYHPSQQNTSTGKLTEEMLRRIFVRARKRITSPQLRP